MDLRNWLARPDRPPVLMGVLNITPDSFSDGGLYADTSAAVERARQLVAEGAALIDIGGESTRPGAVRIPADEQIRRIVPAIRAIAGTLGVPVSVDTTRAAVAEAALDAGAAMINDISAGREDAALFPLLAARQVPVVLMHMLGTPATMQQAPQYDDVVADVKSFLQQRISAAQEAGIAPGLIVVDPGIGFGKTVDHNLSLLKHMADFRGIGQAVLIGTSRKSFIGTLTGQSRADDRVFGTAGSIAWAVANGADIVRVHDVAAMRQVMQVVRAIHLAQ